MAYPTAAQVLSPIVFGAANELTGTYVAPAASNVKAGVNFGVGATGTLESADYTDLVQERRTSSTVVGSLIATSAAGSVRIAIYDNATWTPESRAIAHVSAINGLWANLLELPNGKTYRLVHKDRNNQVVRTETLAL